MNHTIFSRRSGRLLGVLLALILAVPCIPAAARTQPRTLRVPYVEMEGLVEKDSNGVLHGLTIDYLNEIAKYTGWDYAFVETNGNGMVDGFLAGEYDLMTGTYYLPVMEQYCAYPDYTMGSAKAVLLARRDDASIRGTNIRSIEGKTIGVYDRAQENVRRLKEFLSMNGLHCTLKYYTYDQLSVEGNLYSYLESGEVDLLLGNSAERNGPFRVAFSYDGQPYYIVGPVGDREILDGLNMALEKILSANPNFAAERYAANYPDTTLVDITLSDEERDYIQKRDTVTVAVPGNFHPLCCCQNDQCEHAGLVMDVLEEISGLTGLKFSYVYAQTYLDAIHTVQSGGAEILGFFMGTEAKSLEQGLALTAPFTSLNSIVVRNKKIGFPGPDLVGAVLDGRELPDTLQAAQTRAYPDAEEALKAVNRGEADFVFGMAPYLEWMLQSKHYANVTPVTIVNDRSDVCLALPRPADAQLLTILNKAINSIPASQKTQLLDQNIVSPGTGPLSLTELIYANPLMVMAAVFLLLSIFAASAILIARTKMKAAIMRSNLEKAEAESRAKGEFLSRMSHELRTPMNAVVGLADLTSMAQGVPEAVRDNLAKLRTSSYYLLELINDILDMSRLDSGMLTIASEPFSLEEMLGKIQDLLDGDARRRGLVYTLDRQISHFAVVGDGIRLRQVLINLLSNAFKFTPQGGTVTLRIKETARDGKYAAYAFSVSDSGAGVAQEDQSRIFGVFEQVGTNYAKSQGTGLGLPISRKIVQQMGGELQMTSAVGKGSTFFFEVTLPLADPADLAGAPPRPAAALAMLEGARIMLVEDNDLNAEIAGELLAIRGVSVTRIENGKLAVERFRQSDPQEFQAVLMDIQMPEMNGLEAARAIRGLERPDAGAIPIIAMTANAFQEDVDAALDAGMNGFISKPVDVERLFDLLRELIGGGSGD